MASKFTHLLEGKEAFAITQAIVLSKRAGSPGRVKTRTSAGIKWSKSLHDMAVVYVTKGVPSESARETVDR